ncbi:protein CsbA [Bacillus sp. CHD6a]|nr:protein CsbA [Bacillus sp. CHD6a]
MIPALLVVLFTRVTYNLYVGTGLAVALLIVSIFKGYGNEWFVIVVDVLSLVIGFLYARKMVGKFK